METFRIDEIARRLLENVPPAFRSVQKDLESNFRAVLRASLGKLDLVTRDEFDTQTRVLERTRALLEALEARLQALEGAGPAGAGAPTSGTGAPAAGTSPGGTSGGISAAGTYAAGTPATDAPATGTPDAGTTAGDIAH
jgi:ubiquinone biosynthesis accessory factor UbiK